MDLCEPADQKSTQARPTAHGFGMMVLMGKEANAGDRHSQILNYWWLLELLSPQKVPKLTRPSTRPAERQTIEWGHQDVLPWEKLAPPVPIGKANRVWKHTIYVGVYELEATYESLRHAFGDDTDAYDQRPPGQSACAGMVVDDNGRLDTDSAVLSSALWALARLQKPGPHGPSALEGFDGALNSFVEVVEEHEGSRRDACEGEQPPPIDADAIQSLIHLCHTSAGLSGLEDVATDRVVIQSVAVAASKSAKSSEVDFLNSFYLDDLIRVKARLAVDDVGPALAAYLTPDGDVSEPKRVDVVSMPHAVDLGVTVGRIPRGRWPAQPKHPLALSQQFAVNQALNDLAPGAGLIGVNGPPGTGKTTMLRDILAGNVVERARRLATLVRPEEAFTDTPHVWSATGNYKRIVPQLRPEFTGFEMVVASANNAAVENISTEIPGRRAVEQPWRGTADYFGEIATAAMRETADREPSESDQPLEAWGLVAARLGKKSNRAAFRSAFWFDKNTDGNKTPKDKPSPRMMTRLSEWSDGTAPFTPWKQARKDFSAREQHVNALLKERQLAEARLVRRQALITDERTLTIKVEKMQAVHARADQGVAAHIPNEQRAETDWERATTQHGRQIASKPGAIEAIFSFGSAVRNWRAELAPRATQLRATENRFKEAKSRGDELRAFKTRTANDLEVAKHDHISLKLSLRTAREECAIDAAKYREAYPVDAQTGDARELRAPWIDQELDTARSDLFLAALRLHQDFMANTAKLMLDGLRAATEVVAGEIPQGLEPEKVQAAWQLFFLTVPLVSTTFASADRMLTGMGRESIGWLLIDEAGQACPQYAAGSIWRARRVVVVGDPLQLQPVVTVPHKVQGILANAWGVSPTWIPPLASVQTLADRVATYGTNLSQSGKSVWVSAPLRVHRRCDDPMFTLCNKIAYNEIMTNGVVRKLDDPNEPDKFDSITGPIIAPSFWADEPATVSGSHLQPSQIDRLEKALKYLSDRGIPASDVIAISPFRDVADRLSALSTLYPGMQAGTIHTAQGREALVVILVLGGDPSSPGAKAWAASTVNLLNVAASRAQRRLYVIGDRVAWEQHNYFRQLSSVLI